MNKTTTNSNTTQQISTQGVPGKKSSTQEQILSMKQEQLNKNVNTILPPGLEGNTYGHLFIEIGDMHWLEYDGLNYLQQEMGSTVLPLHNLFANFKFWGDQTKGLYLKCANGMKKKEVITNKFKFDIKCPEKSFEKYLDDMGVLIVDFYDIKKNQTIGTSKVLLKLYIKRAKGPNDDAPLIELRGTFPITLTGNEKVKIGEFSISIISSFTDPFNTRGIQKSTVMNLDESFIQNERKAQEDALAQNRIKGVNMERAFSDDRVPTSLQDKRQANYGYRKTDFDLQIDERPVRDRSAKPQGTGTLGPGKENQRNLINIDENEDTYHNQEQFDKIFSRGERLKQQMDDALQKDNAWETLHGQFEVPKKYVPPFLQKDEEIKKNEYSDEHLDNLYDLELEGDLLGNQTQNNKKQGETISDPRQSFQPQLDIQRGQETAQLRDMKFIKIKIKTLRIENEELNQKLLEPFTLSLDIPLPDIYQKKILFQQSKLNNYDIVSFNEFEFNSLTLYNFKFDDETFNQLVQSFIKVSIEGHETTGQLMMNKVLLAKNYTLDASIPLEKKFVMEQVTGAKGQAKKGQVQSKQQEKSKPQQKKQVGTKPVELQTITRTVGHLTIEINLQRGDTEEELSRNYQLKLKQIEENRIKEIQEKKIEAQKKLMYNINQEPIFAQIYLNIDSVRNLQLQQDGSSTAVDKNLQNQTFNMRQPDFSQNGTPTSPSKEIQPKQVVGPKRNLFIRYRSFPQLEKLQTQTCFDEIAPSFNYRSQFPIVMTPDILEKLEKFIFVLEVWDASHPSKEDLIGLVKIPLTSFCHSMKTTDQNVYSLNFLADQHCLYPMMIADEYLPIYSLRLGENVGLLKVTLALGSPVQINRQIQKEQIQEQELQKATIQKQIAEQLQQKLLQEEELKRRQEDERQARFRQEEDDRRTRQQQEAQRSLTPDRSHSPLGNMMANYLKQSINVSASRDLDIRKMTFLHCLRKLFEEARGIDVQELNGEEIFKDSIKNFDGSIKKDEFVASILEKDEFTLTRTEISNICILFLNINRNDNNNIDIDEIQFSYKSYLKYYELIESRIMDLLEKFKLQITKKIEDPDTLEMFIRQIEEKSVESKLSIADLKELLDNNGISIRDALYDQLCSYFDLDRNDSVYIKSFCDYLRNPSMKNFNFFKVNPNILTQQISEFVKNSVETNKEYLTQLEQEFKVELHKAQGKSGNIEEIPPNFLQGEKINAKLFQFKLKRLGVVLSLWEVFTLFEQLNTTYAKMFYEPTRYHFITYDLFYKFVTAQDYENKAQQDQMLKSTESAFALAQDLNKKDKKKKGHESSEDGIYSNKSELDDSPSEEDDVVISPIKRKNQQQQRQVQSEQNLQKIQPFPYQPVNKAQIVDQQQQTNDSLGGQKKSSRGNSKGNSKEVTFIEKDKYSRAGLLNQDEERDVQRFEYLLQQQQIQQDAQKQYRQLKHLFEIKVKELKNIPILDKLIKDVSNYEFASSTQIKSTSAKKSTFKQDPTSKYIQNAAIKYAFPLDEDEILESDYLQLKKDSVENASLDYKVSMNTVHTYILNKDEKIQKLLQHQNSQGDQLFNLSLVLYEQGKEFVVGNAQLPIEDIIDLVNMHEQKGDDEDCQTLNRVLFVYGTTFSQRENCIVGKMLVEITYQTQRVPLSHEEVQQIIQGQDISDKDPSQSCFMHRETYINRKIPLNAILSVQIDRISNLKEQIENIEHFSKIQQSLMPDSSKGGLGAKSGTSKGSKKNLATMNRDQAERKRVLTQVMKQGLNLCVYVNLFDEDSDLKQKFPQSSHFTRLLYNTLNPIFGESLDINLQMDTKIFDYLKNKKAIFEVRHYIIQTDKNIGGTSTLDNRESQIESYRSQITEDDKDLREKSEFIVLGYVKVPLLNLITKNNGIDGDFQILDEYKQQIGSLRMRIALNHHSSQRPLYSTTNKIPTQVQLSNQDAHKTTMIDRTLNFQNSLARGKQTQDQQYILGVNFVELILKNKEHLFSKVSQVSSQPEFLYLKFQFLGQFYQSKFISTSQGPQQSQFLKSLNLRVFDIRRSAFIDIDFSRQREIEEAFSKPLEIQLWYKKENTSKYLQNEKELLLGSFFVELNDLSKIKNKRLRDGNGLIQGYEGYFTIYDYENEQVGLDRLGARFLLIKKGNFHSYKSQHNTIEYENQAADLEVLFHNLQSVESGIKKTLDPQGKGHVDLDDLKALIQKELQDPYASMLLAYVDNLEYKNQDKVYYSPLFELPAPYFRYAKRFDHFGIIEKFNKELQGLDNHENGFAPLALFRSVLEHELKIKEKIVIDFVQNMKDSEHILDVNVISHSFKTHIDYIVLLRKLCLYYERRYQNQDKSQENNLTSHRSIESESQHTNDVVLKIQIESAMRIKNPLNELEPPNSFVQLRSPFVKSVPDTISTNNISKSSYPAWHATNNLKFPLMEQNLKILMENPLEFEVYHTQLGHNDTVKSVPIGVAYVDLSQMIFIDDVDQIQGYFHIVKKERFRESISLTEIEPSKLSAESLGQIKITIGSSFNLKRMMNNVTGGQGQSQKMRNQHSPLKEKRQYDFTIGDGNNPFQTQNQMSFGQHHQDFRETYVQSHLLSQTHQKLEQSLKQHNFELNAQQDDSQLKMKLSQKMNDLDELNRKLKTLGSFKGSEILDEEKYEEQPYHYDFAMTRGYNQSAQLQSQFQGFNLPTRDALETKYGAHPNDVVDEAVEEQSELERDDNVFSNNMSDGKNRHFEDGDEIRDHQRHLSSGSPSQNFNIQQIELEERKFLEEDLIPSKDEINDQQVDQQNNSSQNVFDTDFDKRENSQVKSQVRPSFMDDEDIDLEEMERLNRILKSQKK